MTKILSDDVVMKVIEGHADRMRWIVEGVREDRAHRLRMQGQYREIVNMDCSSDYAMKWAFREKKTA